jgi:hypothetical protein
MSHIVWRLGLALIWVLGRRGTTLPFMRTRQAVLLLLLLVMVGVLMGGHVGSRLSRRGRQRSIDLRGVVSKK